LYNSGETQRARDLKKTLSEAKRHMRKNKKKVPRPEINFDEPTQEMKEEAKRFGLDLNDPVIRQELNKLKQHKGKYPEKQTQGTTIPDEVQAPEPKSNDWFFSIAFLVVFIALVLMIEI
jgi:hypothetical protein